MPITSGTYDFCTPQNVELIEEAFQRAGTPQSEIDGEKVKTGLRSMNFILQGWINKGLMLFTIRQNMLALKPNQYAYNLPLHVSDILEATMRTSRRMLGGTASASSGVAQNAFDNNENTACTQSAPNGNISYSWGSTRFQIAMVGVQSNATLDYTLVCEYSFDGATWTSSLSIPIQSYPVGIVQWLVIPAPLNSNYFRIRETGGATLNIQELYFNTLVNDVMMSRVAREIWIAFPNKNQPGQPSNFYVDRQINPIVNIYPAPNTYFNNMFYTSIKQIQDIGTLANTAEVPTRFIPALCSTLAYVLYLKRPDFDANKATSLLNMATTDYQDAYTEDRERVPLQIYSDYSSGYLQS